MPSNFALKTMNTVHRAMMGLSGGRMGWTAAKMPVLELTTIGRKSGQERSTMLTAPWEDGERLVIVASAGGNDKHPAWYLNLSAEPVVTVRTKDQTRSMTARTVSGDERAKLWGEISTAFSNCGDYQSKTEREIPVVMLDPVAS